METKREMKRITAQAFNKKDLMFLWSKKARPFINFLVRHLVRLPRAVHLIEKLTYIYY